MIQIKLFLETTYSSKQAGPDAPKIVDLEKKVNIFLAEKANEITVKDIKYSVQSPNPNQSMKEWTVMVIYDINQ